MKKLLLFFLLCILCLPTHTVFANAFNVTVQNKSANAGDTVDIQISLENNSGIIAALFNVTYDTERLELTGVQDGQLLEGGTFSQNFKAYPYKMVWNSASTENFTKDGILAVLQFKVKENAQSGKAFINLSYNENDVFDVDLNNVPVTIINGSIDVATKSASSSTGPNLGSGTHRPSGTSSISVNNNKKSEETLKEQIVLTIGKKEAVVFGETMLNDVAPIIKNDRTMLPARFVAENLGAKVTWDSINRKVIITKADIEIIITIDSQTALVNGAAIVLDSPACIENDRTYTPLRFIAEKLGANVVWYSETQKVVITK